MSSGTFNFRRLDIVVKNILILYAPALISRCDFSLANELNVRPTLSTSHHPYTALLLLKVRHIQQECTRKYIFQKKVIQTMSALHFLHDKFTLCIIIFWVVFLLKRDCCLNALLICLMRGGSVSSWKNWLTGRKECICFFFQGQTQWH